MYYLFMRKWKVEYGGIILRLSCSRCANCRCVS